MEKKNRVVNEIISIPVGLFNGMMRFLRGEEQYIADRWIGALTAGAAAFFATYVIYRVGQK